MGSSWDPAPGLHLPSRAPQDTPELEQCWDWHWVSLVSQQEGGAGRSWDVLGAGEGLEPALGVALEPGLGQQWLYPLGEEEEEEEKEKRRRRRKVRRGGGREGEKEEGEEEDEKDFPDQTPPIASLCCVDQEKSGQGVQEWQWGGRHG